MVRRTRADRHTKATRAPRRPSGRTAPPALDTRMPRDAAAHIALLRHALAESPRDPTLIRQLAGALTARERDRVRPFEDKVRTGERAVLDLEAGFSAGHDVRDALAATYHRLGQAYFDLGRHCCAISRFQRSLSLAPADPCSQDGLAKALLSAGRVRAAETAFRRLVELTPRNAEPMGYLAWNLRVLMRFDESLDWSERALEADPGCVIALRAASEVLFHRARYDRAAELLERARAAAPDSNEVRLQVAFHRLALGDFRAGWAGYEERFHPGPGELNEPRFVQPRWDGSDLAGKTILIDPEQGVGDILQHARFLPALRKLGAVVILPCTCELFNLMRGCDGVDLVADPDSVPELGFDTYLPICSLPHALGLRMEELPFSMCYVRADAVQTAQWSGRLESAGSGARFRVGLAWAGNPDHVNDFSRSLAPEALVPLAGAPDVEFVSLQVGRRAPRSVATALALVDWTDELADFAQTAALIANLDLVISADTAVAHLSGAMGVPVWTLVSYDSDYRWLKGRDDSPWYPTMRLFRQTAPLEWEPVLQRVRAALHELVSTSAKVARARPAKARR